MSSTLTRPVILHVIGMLVAVGLFVTGFMLRAGRTDSTEAKWLMVWAYYNAGAAMAAALAVLGLVMHARSKTTNWLLVASTIVCVLLCLLWIVMPGIVMASR